MKKIFSLLWGILSIALVNISFTFAYTQEQQEAYYWAYQYWITSQPTIEAARMNSPVTRQAFSKMVINYLENVVWVKQTVSYFYFFPDENKITEDLKPYTQKICAYKIMWTGWKAFKPTEPVDRAQLWTVLSRILRWDEYNSTGKGYYIYHLNALNQIWVMNKIDNPKAYAKRWDVMIILKRIHEKYGSGVYMNGGKISVYWDTDIIKNNFTWITVDKTTEDKIIEDKIIDNKVYEESVSNSWDNNEGNRYLSVLYENSNVIYTWEDGTKYYYDDNFLNMLRIMAENEWESDLANYLQTEAEYFKKWLDQLESIDLDTLTEILWINEDDVDFKSMTVKEKEEFIKNLKEWVNKLVKDTKDRNNKYVNDLENITKVLNDNKFFLKDKYEETKSFIEKSNNFLDLYSEIIFKLIELTVTSEDGEIDDDKAVEVAFSLMWSVFTYQSVAEKYQSYIERWATYIIKVLDKN